MPGQTGPTGQDPAALRRATVAASVASVALVLGGWAAVAESNEGKGGVDVVAVAEQAPLDTPAVAVPAPGAEAATRTVGTKAVRPVPVTPLFREPVCPAGVKGGAVASARSVRAAGAEIATLGADYPEAYSGHIGCRSAGKLIVYRVPMEAFDAAAREIAAREDVTLQLVKAPFSRQQLEEMNAWIDARRKLLAARGIEIRAVGNKPNGTLELGVDPGDVAAAAKRLAKFRAQVRVVPYAAKQ